MIIRGVTKGGRGHKKTGRKAKNVKGKRGGRKKKEEGEGRRDREQKKGKERKRNRERKKEKGERMERKRNHCMKILIRVFLCTSSVNSRLTLLAVSSIRE